MFSKFEPQAWPDLIWSYGDAEKAPPVFAPGAGVKMGYARSLRALARQVGKILKNNSPHDAEKLLQDYAANIEPWARKAAQNMLYGLDRDNLAMFRRQAKRMGLDMGIFLNSPEAGEVIARQIAANTQLITSIPREAARHAGDLAHESLITSARPEELAKKLRNISHVSLSRANVIARTETSKAYAALTRTRAQGVGSEGYIWRTGRDGAVRPSHRAMEGKFVKWDEPPTLDGMTGHAGEFPNCRCYTEPVIPRLDGSQRPFFQGLPTQEEEKESGVKLFKSQWEKTVASRRENKTGFIPHLPGTPLFNVEKARFEPRKLTHYSLDNSSDKGRDKARVWKAAIGATKKDAADIERQVMAMLPKIPAMRKKKEQIYGEKFEALVPVRGPNGKTVEVMTAWIYDRLENGTGFKTIPRLTTIYVHPKSGAR